MEVWWEGLITKIMYSGRTTAKSVLRSVNFRGCSPSTIKSVRTPIVEPSSPLLRTEPFSKAFMRGGVFNPASMPNDFLDERNRIGKHPGYSKVARAVYRSLPSYVAAISLYEGVTVPVTMVDGDHDLSHQSNRDGAVVSCETQPRPRWLEQVISPHGKAPMPWLAYFAQQFTLQARRTDEVIADLFLDSHRWSVCQDKQHGDAPTNGLAVWLVCDKSSAMFPPRRALQTA